MLETARVQENIKYSVLKDTSALCNHMGGVLLGEKIEYIIRNCIIMQILGALLRGEELFTSMLSVEAKKKLSFAKHLYVKRNTLSA